MLYLQVYLQQSSLGFARIFNISQAITQENGIWEETLQKAGRALRRHGAIDEIRWLSKSQAVTKIFGSYSEPDKGLFIELLLAFNAIANDSSFQEAILSDIKVLMDHFQKFEMILTAFIFIRIYSIAASLSIYLLKKGRHASSIKDG